MQTYDPLKEGYINPAHLDLLTPDARANVITVDPDAPKIAEVTAATVADPVPGDEGPFTTAPLSMDERISTLERLVREQAAAIAMLQDSPEPIAWSEPTDVLSGLEAAHIRHVLNKYFSGPNDKPVLADHDFEA